jgi:hypothetical protein
MRLAVYGAVLVITLGSVLLGLDWLSAPMSPMADTEAGLRAPPAVLPPPPAPVAITPVAPSAPIGTPIVPPRLVAPTVPSPPAATTAQAPDPPIAAPEPQVQCNVDACTAAYRSFRASDCTYIPSFGQRKLCTK